MRPTRQQTTIFETEIVKRRGIIALKNGLIDDFTQIHEVLSHDKKISGAKINNLEITIK